MTTPIDPNAARSGALSKRLYLTRGQEDVLARLVGGMTYDEIAAELGIAANAISQHLRRARDTNDLRTNWQLVAVYTRQRRGADDKDPRGDQNR